MGSLHPTSPASINAGTPLKSAGDFLKNNSKFVALVVAVILLVAVLALASLQIFRQVETYAEAQANSLSLLLRADAVLSDLMDADTAQHRFAQSGEQ